MMPGRLSGSAVLACTAAQNMYANADGPWFSPTVASYLCGSTSCCQCCLCSVITTQMPTLAALTFHKLCGSLPTLPHAAMGYAENFLYMLQAQGDSSYRPAPRMVSALEALLLLHAEHGMSCCTAAVRHLASR